jgi:hypothetical protein
MDQRLRLKNGSRIGPKELVLVARDGELVEVRGAELHVGDWVGLRYGEGFPSQPVPLPGFALEPDYGSQNRVRVPTVLDADLALLLGMYASEGHTSRSNYSITITNSEDAVLERCVELWDRCFGLKARITRPRDRCPGVVANSKTVVRIFDVLECGTRASNKRIPWAVMGSPMEVVLAFLQGLALDAYTSTTGHNAKWAICLDAPLLLDDLQLLLRWWGIRSGRIGKYNPIYDKTYDEVFVSGSEAQRLVHAVPFLEPTKQPSAERLLRMAFDPRQNGADVVPLVHGSVLYAGIPKGRAGKNGEGTGVAVKWRSLNDRRTRWPSREIVQRISAEGYVLPTAVQRVLDDRLHFSTVVRCPVRAQGC